VTVKEVKHDCFAHDVGLGRRVSRRSVIKFGDVEPAAAEVKWFAA
jgi:hypothetical protein